MITTSTGERPLKQGRVIDIGGVNSYANGKLDAIIDIRQPQASARKVFVMDICNPDHWKWVELEVKKNGKWDYAICTHTLEDVRDPFFVISMIEKIAHSGLIVVPSKYRELGRFQGNHRGYMHHYWIFDIQGDEAIAYPKHPFIEYMDFDTSKLPDNEELIIEWEGKIPIRQLNDGNPFGTETLSGEEHMKQLYKML